MKIDLSVVVKVQLTAFGEAVLAKNKLKEDKELRGAECPKEGLKKGLTHIWRNNALDKEGFRSFQLYELMRIFGEHISEYAEEMPFEGNSFVVIPETYVAPSAP